MVGCTLWTPWARESSFSDGARLWSTFHFHPAKVIILREHMTKQSLQLPVMPIQAAASKTWSQQLSHHKMLTSRMDPSQATCQEWRLATKMDQSAQQQAWITHSTSTFFVIQPLRLITTPLRTQPTHAHQLSKSSPSTAATCYQSVNSGGTLLHTRNTSEFSSSLLVSFFATWATGSSDLPCV